VDANYSGTEKIKRTMRMLGTSAGEGFGGLVVAHSILLLTGKPECRSA
jgi:hypothetical protein